MTAYYNEFDPFAAEWLRELIKEGHIAPGVVDTRSIEDVSPSDLDGFTQCHFFAGIGVWSYALRQAGWPDDRPVWTGSCPCQPFSVAGKRGGTGDERHLWPVWMRLIREHRPPVVFGEQVASRLVTGRYGGDGMQSLWEARQFLHFRKDWLEGNYEISLQGMQEFGSEKVGEISARQYPLASEQTGSCGQEEGSRERSSFRSGRRVGAGETRSRTVPIERGAIRPDGDPGVFNAIPGQDRSKRRLYKGEHAGNPVWTERSSRDLGGEEIIRCGDQFDQDAIESINDLIAEISCELEEEDGESWINTLQLDLGRSGYTLGACVAPAAGFGAPHIRQRMYWVADSNIGSKGMVGGCGSFLDSRKARDARLGHRGLCSYGRLADSCCEGLQERISNRGISRCASGSDKREATSMGRASACGLADAEREQEHQKQHRPTEDEGRWSTDQSCGCSVVDPSQYSRPTDGHWRDADWLLCRDGKWRPVEPGSQPLAHGAPNRVGRLRGYGNALVAPQAQAFIEAYMGLLCQ